MHGHGRNQIVNQIKHITSDCGVNPVKVDTLIAATNMEQLKSNIASLDVKLSSEVRKKIEEIHRDHPMPF